MTNVPIYTIGYGNRPIKEFVRLLQKYEIRYLVDIRSLPYSRFNPDFSKAVLEKHLKQAGVRYMFMGDSLGGRPDDNTCYTEDGRVNYAEVHEKPFFQDGIERIHTAWRKQLHVALMCSEAKPHECHRSKLIGNTLIEQEIDVAHIDENGQIKTQKDVDRILTGSKDDQTGQLSWLDDQSEENVDNKDGKLAWLRDENIAFSRKKYSPAAEEV